MSDLPATPGADGNSQPSAPLGFIKVEVARCSATTKAGTPCMAPAAGGTEWCVNHRKKFQPDWVPPLTRTQIREMALVERTAQIVAKHELEDKQDRKKHGRRYRKNLIAALQEEMELHPKHVTQLMLEGLQATKTVRRRVLNEDGTEAAVAHVWIDEHNGLTHMNSEPVYEDVEVVDHQMRLAYAREIYDRLYGRPSQRKDANGDGERKLEVNVGVLLAQASKLEKDPAAYYAEVPGLPEPVIDVGEGEVVSSAPPV